MDHLIWIILGVSLGLGVGSGMAYCLHPLAGTPLVSYPGKKWWAIAFICILAIYLKS